ncbi:uncharacterized protein JN550_007797 [Neoarthrinium moseri]|uniref:uncharacterized protein n=1 Tax=Neoarthrinium moseri TaxID=1658444 RepID=UPI001FDB140B|nr:uncharacterized protein JN550_007797 [Neoarthrinium moseri]KAI1866108.1 hypothetical protein JN550_007797 [Neoarthrinium moseri]
MKNSFITVFAILGLTSAFPVDQTHQLDARQLVISDELKLGKCAGSVFIFARGSTEADNMGAICGPQTCGDLKDNLGGDAICQGIGTVDGYAGDLASNFLSKNTNDLAIAGAVKMINQAATQCPEANILLGGYSQGTAVIDNAVQALSASVKSKVKGVVLFGFTRNAQDRGRIPGYDTSRTKVFCALGDLVCDNTLVITAAHLTYGADASAAARFLAGTTK